MEKIQINNYWIEWEDKNGEKSPLRDCDDDVMFYCSTATAKVAIERHGIKAEVISRKIREPFIE